MLIRWTVATLLAATAAAALDPAAGRLLVAKRELRDPNFVRTVILLADYSPRGAMGLVLTRPSEIPLARVFPGIAGAKGNQSTALFGGPVQREAVFALVRGKNPPADAKPVLDGVHMATSRAALERAFERGLPPAEFRVYLGYSGWGPRQLDGEIEAGAWSVLPATADLVFDADPEGLWEKLIRRGELNIASTARRPRGGTTPRDSRTTPAGRGSTSWTARARALRGEGRYSTSRGAV